MNLVDSKICHSTRAARSSAGLPGSLGFDTDFSSSSSLGLNFVKMGVSAIFARAAMFMEARQIRPALRAAALHKQRDARPGASEGKIPRLRAGPGIMGKCKREASAYTDCLRSRL